MPKDLKNYELAYLFAPSISEEDVLMLSAKISSLIESVNGIVNYVETPKKIKLAYPIAKNVNAYFGWKSFSISPEFINEFIKKLKSQENILRYLLVVKDAATKKTAYSAGSRILRKQPVLREQEKLNEPLDLEGLDKKLEEILGK